MEDQDCTGEIDAGGREPPMASTAIRKSYIQRLHEIFGHKMNSWALWERLQHYRLGTLFSGTFQGSIINTGISRISQYPTNL